MANLGIMPSNKGFVNVLVDRVVRVHGLADNDGKAMSVMIECVVLDGSANGPQPQQRATINVRIRDAEDLARQLLARVRESVDSPG